MSETLDILRAKYEEVTGKKPFNGWKEDELQKKISEANKNPFPDEATELKQEVPKKEDIPEEPVKEVKNSSDTIEVDKAEFESLKEMVANLKTSQESLEQQSGLGTWKLWEEPKKPNSTATLKVFQETSDSEKALIVDWKHDRFVMKDVPASDGGLISVIDKDIYKIKLLYADNSEKWVELPLPTFARITETIKVEILSKEKTELYQNQGQVAKTYKDKEGYRLAKGGQVVKTDEIVDLIVKMNKVVCTVKLPDGRKLKIPAERLNA